jgi:hypothetical protein
MPPATNKYSTPDAELIATSRRQTLRGSAAMAFGGLLGIAMPAMAQASPAAADADLLAVCARLQAARADIDAAYIGVDTIADEERIAPKLDHLFMAEFDIEDELWPAVEACRRPLSEAATQSLIRVALARSAHDEFRQEICELIVRDIAAGAGGSDHRSLA